MEIPFTTSPLSLRLLSCAVLLAAFADAQAASSVTLAPSQNPSNFGHAVTLTATVTSGATGKVTFYDGVNVLGTSPLTGSQATFTTALLPSGTRYLRAHYLGDASHASSNSSVVTQTILALPSLGLQQASTYPIASAAGSVAIGDFNGDGKPDLIAATPYADTSAEMFLGHGDGTFQATTFNLGVWPAPIVIGDFNEDGKLDVAFADSWQQNTLDVALGNGDGTFGKPTIYSISPVLNVPRPAVGDFNGDGNPDLAVSLGSSVGILLGNGGGSFRSMVTYPASNADTITLGDFNGDGVTDIAAVGQDASNFQILLGNGDGTFQAAVNHSMPALCSVVVVADFNGDGKADLAISEEFYIDILLGNGDGTFQAAIRYFSIGPASLTVADINGDGKPDLVAGTGTLSVFLGNGDGTFQSPVSYPGSELGGVAAGDFNGDSRTDLAVSFGDEPAAPDVLSVLLGGAAPDLSISLAHGPGFTQGQSGATYTVGVMNVGAYGSYGAVTVTDTLPSGMTATAISGGGWSCAPITLSCMRSDSVAGGASYPGITITVNISASLTGAVTDTVTVSGGGSSNNTATDTASIRPTVSVTVTSSPNPSILGQPVNLTASIKPAAAGGEVTFYDGINVLGSAAVAGGEAVLTTYLLPSGARSLVAEYNPNSAYGAGFSPVYVQTVNPVQNNGQQSVASYPVDTSPGYLAVGDFNQDGKLDLVTTNVGRGDVGTISILLGNGDGTFRAAATYTIGSISSTVVVADFNRDGKSDLALEGTNGIDVLLGNGDGTFQSPVVYGSTGAVALAMADVNRDGIPDLLEGLGSGISVLLGNGDGTFQPGISTPISEIGTFYWIVVDLNGDGVPDLAVVDGSYNGPVSVYLGKGDGTFAQPFNMPGLPTQDSFAITAGDFNADGKQDVALMYWIGAGILLGNGDGSLQSPELSAFGFSNATPGYSALAGDFNGDGKLDIGYRAYASSFVDIAFGNGLGLLPSGASYATDGNTGNLVLADFNGDGKPDFAVVNWSASTVNVFLGGQISGLHITSAHSGDFLIGQSGATYQLTVSNLTFAGSTGTVTVTDTLPAGFAGTAIGGTGWNCVLSTLTCTRMDALSTGSSYPPITVTIDLSAGLSPGVVDNRALVTTAAGTTSVTDPTTIIPYALSLNVTPSSSLLDHEVTMTATVASGETGTVLFLDGLDTLGISAISAGQAHFTTSLLAAGVHQLRAFYGGDAGPAGFSAVTIFTVSAELANTFATALNDTTGSQPTGIAVADFNNDGKTDLVTVNSGAQTVSVLLGNGDGTFAAHADYTVGGMPVAVAVGNFNGDGHPDLAVVNQAGNTLSILLGNGDGTFQTATSSSAGNNPSSIAVGDFNGDGVEDLAVGSASGFALNVLLGNGDGTFQTPILSSFNVGTLLLVEDLNGDGKADLLVGGQGFYYSLLGNGDGTFDLTPWVGYGSGQLAVGDLNGDGIADVAYPVQPSGPAIAVQLGNGDGTFSGSQTFPTSFEPSALAIADVNGDGKLDVIGAGSIGSSVIVLLGNGDGTLQAPLSFGVGTSSAGIAVGDFNGDGRTDLAITHGPAGNNVSILLGQVSALQFYPVAPCRLVDTRGTAAGFNGIAPFSGPSIPGEGTLTIPVQSAIEASTNTTPAPCGVIPSTAQAYSFNITVVPEAGGGVDYVSLWPAGSPQPFVATLNDPQDLIVANAAIVPAGWPSGGISVYNAGPSIADVIIDLNGYFAPASGGLDFYPVAPCRLVDTRGAAAGFNGIDPFAGPAIASKASLTIPVQSAMEASTDTEPAPCGVIPSSAEAYSFNLTAVPALEGGAVDYVSLWPAGATQPFVATLNDPQGKIVADAAIVPAGAPSGGVSVYNDGPATTNLVIDMNGYFAAPTGLRFYPVAPCRLVDTRGAAAGFNGIPPFSGPSIPDGGTLTIPLQSAAEASTNTEPAPCGVIPSTAQAYSINITVVPAKGGAVDYVSLWPAGSTQPFVATLNDPEGLIVANAAIVPAGSPSGGISVYNAGPSTTDVIIDMNGYFAP